MCTVSWLRLPNAYEILCNRDERRTRLPAQPPSLHTHSHGRFLAPLDPQGGGTWIAANDRGLTLCLLNGPSRPSPSATHSRGQIPLHLINAPDAASALHRCSELFLPSYQPFTLLALSPASPVYLGTWDGLIFHIRSNPASLGYLTSSSLDQARAEAQRAAQLRALDALSTLDPLSKLLCFHQSHHPTDLRFSPCMHRDDAETVSFSRVSWQPGALHFYYTPDAPCRQRTGQTWSLSCPFPSSASSSAA